MMGNKRIYSALLAALLLAVSVSTALAAPPLALQIKVDELNIGATPDYFTAEGPAVDDGPMCATVR